MSADPFETRWSLIERLGNQADNEAWNTVVRIYTRLIRSLAVRWGVSQSEADDVTQDVLIALRQKVTTTGFTRDGGRFRSWLSTTTRFVVHNTKKKNGKLQTGAGELLEGVTGRGVEGRAGPCGPTEEFEKEFEAEWLKQIFIEALLQVQQSVSPAAWRAFEMTRRTTVVGTKGEQIHEWHTRAVPETVGKAAAELGWTGGRVHNEVNKVWTKVQALCKNLRGDDEAEEVAA